MEQSLESNEKKSSMKYVVGFLSLTTVGLLAATIVLAVKPAKVAEMPMSNVPDVSMEMLEGNIFKSGENTCKDKNPLWPNVDCIHVPGPQAGANVTKGFVGGLEVDYEPFLGQYFTNSMCPVNVHWHLGTEHYSIGEYDEEGDGPDGNIPAPEHERHLAGKEVRAGFRCHHYDESDPKFTTEYEWKHCVDMKVGETYEVHWPHSVAGACGTVNQFQTPFYDGVFCNLDPEVVPSLTAQDVAYAVGVQGQVFTIVNDESYFYPDMIRGWIVDGDMGKDIAYYTGSTTGTSRSNEICSQYSPITWQVDRKCHMISASSFDKMCYDMKMQRDDMTDDLHAHGSRELVKSSLVANNQHRHLEHDHDHHRHLEHDHDHSHHLRY